MFKTFKEIDLRRKFPAWTYLSPCWNSTFKEIILEIRLTVRVSRYVSRVTITLCSIKGNDFLNNIPRLIRNPNLNSSPFVFSILHCCLYNPIPYFPKTVLERQLRIQQLLPSH